MPLSPPPPPFQRMTPCLLKSSRYSMFLIDLVMPVLPKNSSLSEGWSFFSCLPGWHNSNNITYRPQASQQFHRKRAGMPNNTHACLLLVRDDVLRFLVKVIYSSGIGHIFTLSKTMPALLFSCPILWNNNRFSRVEEGNNK